MLKTRLAKPRKSHLAVMLASLVAGSAATVTALDSWDKILVDLGWKKSESAILAVEGAQGDLVRQMTRMMSNRVFWVARYKDEVADGFPKENQDETWKRYNDSVVDWNNNYMLNVILTEKYFGDQTKNDLADFNWLLRGVNSCLVKIRYRAIYQDKDPACHFASGKGGSEQDNLRVLADPLKQVDALFAKLSTELSK
jgi:hypothetical protein